MRRKGLQVETPYALHRPNNKEFSAAADGQLPLTALRPTHIGHINDQLRFSYTYNIIII